jgi:outer membrane protein, heavy metal efflux system
MLFAVAVYHAQFMLSQPKIIKNLSAVLMMITVMGCPLFAEDQKVVGDFTIEELIQQVLDQNPELRFYEAEVLAAKGQRTQAGLWKNPEFSGEYGEKRVRDGEGNLSGDGFARKVEITQTFEFPGKGSLRKAIANKNVELAEIGLEQFRLALKGQIRNLVYQYLVASANVKAATEINERSTELVESLKRRTAAGAQLLLEQRVIEGSLIELQQSAKEFIQQRDEARIQLNALFGRPAHQNLIVKTSITPPKFKRDFSEFLRLASANNLQLKIRAVELSRSIKELSVSRLDAAPDFTIGPFYSEEKVQEKETIIGVAVSLPLPLWNWNQGNVQTADARRIQADALLLDSERKVQSEVARRLRAYELILQQLDKTPADTVQKLREAAEFADRQYRLGAINVQLYLEVQRQFLSAQQIHDRAVLEAWQSLLDLQLLSGSTIILESSGEEKNK